MDAINQLWSGVLEFLTPLVTPDWGALVGLLPVFLLLPVVLYLVLVTRAWMRLRAGLPAGMRRNLGAPALVLVHAAGIVLGGVVVALAFATAGSPEDGTIGLVVSVPLLLVGLVIAVGTAGSAIVRWEGGPDPDHEGRDPAEAWVARHRRGLSLLLQFIVGAAIAALGLLLLPAADPDTGVQPVASVPLLVIGLLIAIQAAGRAIQGLWGADDDAPEIVALDHA